jgi:hypothetical protein
MTEEERYRWFLYTPGQGEREVTMAEWIRAEKGAGFVGGGLERPATYSFEGINGVKGRRVLRDD